MDNYYNSIELASQTVKRVNLLYWHYEDWSRGIPADFKAAKLKKWEMRARYAEDVMIGKWRDKRTLLYIYTERKNTIGQSRNKRGGAASWKTPSHNTL